MNGRLQHAFTWTIINISFFENGNDKPLISPEFKADNINDKAVWRLRFYPGGKTEPFTTISSCYLYRVPEKSNVEKVECRYSLEVLNYDGRVVHSFTEEAIFPNASLRGEEVFFDMSRINSDPKNFQDDTITIRCHMIGQTASASKTSRNFAETKIGFDQISFEWKIETVINLTRPPKYVFPLGIDREFELNFILKAESIVILVIMKKLRDTKVLFKVSLKDKYDVECLPARFEHLFRNNVTEWSIIYSNAKEEVSSNLEKYILQDTLTLNCEFSASNSTYATSTSEYHYCPSIFEDDVVEDVDTVAALMEDLKKMCKDRKYSDVILLTKDNQAVDAHKAILSARSLYFYKMFEGEGVNEVPTSADLRTLNQFLEYLYTGDIEEWDYDNADNLIELGEKFEIQSLVNDCNKRKRELDEFFNIPTK